MFGNVPRRHAVRCGIASADFHISVVKQGWLASDDPDYDVAAHDLCTHGDIRLTIGGQTIAPGDGQGEYGISEAALGLLRTLESDRPGAAGQQFGYPLIPHGCGAILMMSCPIGIDWTVTHLDDRVRIADIVRYETTAEADAVPFPGIAVEIPLADYRSEITAFARRAKEPFEGIEKAFDDDADREAYANFWEEYDRLLEQAVRASG